MPETTHNDIALVELMCVAEKVGASPTWHELRQAREILRDKGGKAAAAFLACCVPSPARDADNLDRERDRERDRY